MYNNIQQIKIIKKDGTSLTSTSRRVNDIFFYIHELIESGYNVDIVKNTPYLKVYEAKNLNKNDTITIEIMYKRGNYANKKHNM